MSPKFCEKLEEQPLERFYSEFELIFVFYPYRVGKTYPIKLERDEWNMPRHLAVRNDGETFGKLPKHLFQDLLPIMKAHNVKIEVEITGSHSLSKLIFFFSHVILESITHPSRGCMEVSKTF